jgi:cell division protein FtsB
VSLLRSDRVDPDMLDERARFQLDYANPRDLVRTIKPN